MKLLHMVTLSMAVMAGIQTLPATAATTTGTVSTSGAGAPVAEVAGKIVSEDDLTSFAEQMQESGVRGASRGPELLDQYILTKLYDKIPTTATVAEPGKKPESPSPYSLVSQRSLLKRELRDQVSDNIEIPRPEMQAWYEKNLSKYEKPERVHAMHLFMETSDDNPSSSPQQVRERLLKIKSQIDSGTSFSQMAKQYSEAASGESGGEIGMITRRMPIGPMSKPMNLELENAFFALQPGKVSDVIDTRHGMHLLYLTERQTTRTPTLDDMITSGILPGALVQDRLTSELRTLVTDTIAKHQGKALPAGVPEEGVTTDTVAFELDGRKYTIGGLVALFGPRFESYLDSIKEESRALTGLMEQALEDEAMIQAAIDKGLDKTPETAQELKQLGAIEVATKRIDAIASAEANVTEDEIQTRYNALKNELRQPEAEGMLLMIQSKPATGTAEQAHAREDAQTAAQAIHKRLETENFKAVATALQADSDLKTTMTEMPRHVIGRSTVPLSRVFDQAIAGMRDESGLGDVMPVGSDYAIARLVKKYPGEPLPLADVRERLKSMLESSAESAARQEMISRLEEKGLVKYLPGAVRYGKIVPGAGTHEATTGTQQ